VLKAFLHWASTEPAYRDLADPKAASGRKTREVLGAPIRRDDYLQREQLKSWFAAVRALPNPVTAAYLQTLLLTGARREELASLRWDDVNFRWKGIHLGDKVHDEGREIPLTPYVESLLEGLPRRNEWVFASVRSVDLSPKGLKRRARYHAARGQQAPAGGLVEVSASGRIKDPASVHSRACVAAGIEGLTLHGLRRSFASLCEWLEIPGGVAAQIQGHAPQGVREQNYIRRPLDLLRVHHEAIERWMLGEAGIRLVHGANQKRLGTLGRSDVPGRVDVADVEGRHVR
jgi:integrase